MSNTVKIKKKKTIRKKAIPENSKKVQMKPDAQFLDDQGRLRFTRQDLLEVENYRLRAESHTKQAQNLHLKAEQHEVNARLTVRALRNDALAEEKKAAAIREDQRNLFIRLGQKYKVDFKLATYDDESGVILVHEDANTPDTSESG